MIDVDRLPREIRESKRCVVWTTELRDGKETKVPYNPPRPGERAAVDNPTTWASFDEALRAVENKNAEGVGIILGEGLCGIDFDDCRDPETEQVEPWALDIVQKMDSYTEVSPSGSGLHILLRGDLPPGRRRKGKIEMYSEGRYFTVTGESLGPPVIEERNGDLAALHAEVFGKNGGRPEPPPRRETSTQGIDDAEILERARSASNGAKFSALWSGDRSGYTSHSEADQALANALAFWTGRDAARIDRLFRASGLYREKWDRSDYRARTIAKAIADCRETYSSPPKPTPAAEKKVVEQVVEIHPTDLGNARRFVKQHGNRARFCHPWNRWLLYSRRWNVDDSAAMMTFAKETALAIYSEAANEADDEHRKALARHAVVSERAERLAAMLKLAASEPGIPILPDDLDRDPWLLNVENGTLDLRTGKLCPHDPANLLTKLVPAPYDSTATCPTWERFLDEVIDARASLIAFLKRAVGYSLTGSTQEQVFFLLYGTGANGKTTFVETVRALLGDYGQQAAFETFLEKRRGSDGPRNDLAELRGARFVSASEAEAGRRLSETLVKHLTGGDTIRARHLYAENFQFTPQFKLWLASNHKPAIFDSSLAMWRRVRLVPFTVTIPQEEQDRELGSKLRAELPGILRWAVEGCLDWLEHGLGEPEDVTEATSAYRDEQDIVAGFVNGCCHLNPDAKTKAADLYRAYKRWAEESEQEPVSQTVLGLSLGEKGLVRKREGRGYFWHGIALRPEDKSVNPWTLVNPFPGKSSHEEKHKILYGK